MLVSSHVLHEVQALTPNIILLNRGRLVAEGHVRQIRDLIDKHPHRIVLVCDDYRALGGQGGGLGRRRGRQGDGRRQGAAGGDAPAGRLLRPIAGAGEHGRRSHPRGLFRRRQPGSRVQIPGESLENCHAPAPNREVSFRHSISALGALFILTLRQHLHGRRLLVLALLFLIPSVLSLVVRLTPHAPPPAELEFAFIFNLIPHALVTLTALLYAAGIMQDEVEGQTLTYLLLRPLPCWRRISPGCWRRCW